MANWTILKEAIAHVVKTNGNQEITGAVLQNTLNSIVNSVGENATFAGIATPTTNPGTSDGPVFYIATTTGSYSNFGNIEISKGESAILKWNNGIWTKNTFKPMTDFNSVYDSDGNNLTKAFERLHVDIVQSTGTSTTAVMSQKAVSNIVDAIRDQVNNYKPIVIEGNVTNAADEEDITSENGLLKLKNRSALNGMGYVILRQNKGFAEQVTKANTVYEIRYDFDLNGADITIPENCVLNFTGGSLSNGTIEFDNTKIESNTNVSIFKTITFKGNASNKELDVSQFSYGVHGDCLDNAISWLKTQNIKLKAKIITLNRDIDFKSVIIDFWEVQLNGHTIKLGGGNRLISNIPGNMSKSYNQKIEIIGSNGKRDSSKVIIEKCYGIKLYIGFFDNDIIFQTNTENTAIAYSEFNFVHVQNLIFRNTDNYNAGWINENRFVLQRSLKFIVEDSLKYFDHNAIYGGCFEGSYEIRLEVGTKNIFRDIRNETNRSVANGKLYFGKNTKNNIYYGSETSNGYIYDYGTENTIILNNIAFTKNIFNDNISFEDVKENRLNRFKNLKVSGSGTGIVIDKNTGIQEIYESPFLRLDNILYGILEVSSKLEPGIGIGYEVFNENFERITFTKPVTFALLTTSDSCYKDGTEGEYVPSNRHTINHGGSEQNNFISNKYQVLKVFPHNINEVLNENDVALVKTVKYVKFKIGTNSYHGNIINTEFMSINFNVFSYIKEYPYQTDIK